MHDTNDFCVLFYCFVGTFETMSVDTGFELLRWLTCASHNNIPNATLCLRYCFWFRVKVFGNIVFSYSFLRTATVYTRTNREV